jgi:uncharacterized protein (DUF302 family)
MPPPRCPRCFLRHHGARRRAGWSCQGEKRVWPRRNYSRIKKDIADEGIRFFSEIDQAKLAADAGIKLRPSTLLVFGNPPLGTQFITANPNAGLD